MKVLFIGLGGIGQRHLRIIRRLKPDAQVGAVRARNRSFEIGDDLKPNYNVDIVKKYNITTYPSINSAINFNPDFAVVSNPTSMHLETSFELVNNDIPVFMEKPISNEFKRLDELVKLTQKKNIPFMIGYMMRFNPCAIKLKNMLDKNKLGRIYSINLNINSFMPSWHKYEKYNEFYAGKKELGGGVILTEIHELDLLHWYFSQPDRVWAIGGKYSKFEIDVEDTVGILMEQKNNNTIFPININMSFVQPYPYRKMIILGEKGKIEWNITINEIIIDNNIDNIQEIFRPKEFEKNNMFINQMKHFIECVQNKKEPESSLLHVIGGHYTALSIKKSLEQCNTIDVIKYKSL